MQLRLARTKASRAPLTTAPPNLRIARPGPAWRLPQAHSLAWSPQFTAWAGVVRATYAAMPPVNSAPGPLIWRRHISIELIERQRKSWQRRGEMIKKRIAQNQKAQTPERVRPLLYALAF